MKEILENSHKQGIRFLVIGDWGREGCPEQHHTAAQLARQANLCQADCIISTGDNFYENGVDSTKDPLWEVSFEKVYHHASLQIPWYAVLGNHDYRGNTSAQILYSQQSSRWRMPARYYSKLLKVSESSDLQLIFTDTTPFIGAYWETENHPDVLNQKPEEQVAWLRQTLAESTAQWKIVVGHHPVYSSSPMHGDTEELLTYFLPLFEEFGVDAYLCGHEHDLQLQKPYGHTIYLVSGAGSEVRETDKKEMTLFSQSDKGFACISLDEENMSIEFVNSEGRTIFQTQQRSREYTQAELFKS
ncbi:purple acid phosphatase family protein [Catalinimonas niigatensis]|uniref:purple acid phosphatase family protein n=1 Tax=Catalinimonas niigatensis TaxID=1397264 RepID=UPI002AA2B0C2|nr:tartrate-resistant acid phosphatase type 5 family protein [Catalinimonas niigatensis]WPP53716.1 tartrate-resistant acid phosphatase type 5 family protein [Catalinimonas niigatensis]